MVHFWARTPTKLCHVGNSWALNHVMCSRARTSAYLCHMLLSNTCAKWCYFRPVLIICTCAVWCTLGSVPRHTCATWCALGPILRRDQARERDISWAPGRVLKKMKMYCKTWLCTDFLFGELHYSLSLFLQSARHTCSVVLHRQAFRIFHFGHSITTHTWTYIHSIIEPASSIK